ncbi:hypothetical protein [Psychromonas ossibalaenae]|uniref:hypothetical protein n=1 Tax=Psychromonas ossibalaenae TaxID=444922 RepID=UPI0003754D71|nr:hypothetical protein [Psychromonas ossibalaenae]
MTVFFNESAVVSVSRIALSGWWIQNQDEYVVAGTSLGADCIQDIYTPSKTGMTARYNVGKQSWEDEIEDKTFFEFYSEHGQKHYIGEPDGYYPEGAITEAPPRHDSDTQTVLYQDEQWTVYDIELGKSYWDRKANELLVSDFNFDLPDNHTFTPPPEVSEGVVARLIMQGWVLIEDHRGKMAYAKSRDRGEDYLIEKIGPIPDTHTLLEREEFDSWDEITGTWLYDKIRHRPVWIKKEKEWQTAQLTVIQQMLNAYLQDKHIPDKYAALRITRYSKREYYALLMARKLLHEYLLQDDFPECGRPVLPEIA